MTIEFLKENEEAILSCISTRPKLIAKARSELSVDDFSHKETKRVYGVFLDAVDAGNPIDPSVILQVLNHNGSRDWTDYVAKLIGNLATTAGFEYHIQQIREKNDRDLFCRWGYGCNNGEHGPVKHAPADNRVGSYLWRIQRAIRPEGERTALV